MLGPLFNRALVTLPRRAKFYLGRAAYAFALLVLASTAWQVLAGTQVVRNTGDFARFGAMLFQILAPLQLGIALFASALLAAAAVAVEKDRRTLDLLLLTNLSNTQFVVGKLLGSLMSLWTLLATALPVFALAMLFGGISADQLLRVFTVTLAATLLSGSLGTTIALWREKTFQTVAITATLIVVWLVFWEVVAAGALGAQWLDRPTLDWAIALSPWEAILAATRPAELGSGGLADAFEGAALFVPTALAISAAIVIIGIARFRVWNPAQESQRGRQVLDEHEPTIAPRSPAAAGRTSSRRMWDNPVIWREMRTWAYGRKVLLVRVTYLVLCALAAGALYTLGTQEAGLSRAAAATAMAPLFVLSLILVNAQAVTSVTNERDNKALDLLLVTDITPKEFIFGKLGGVLYNTKEMILAPMLLCAAMWAAGAISLENLLYIVGGEATLVAFVAMLGIHAGLTYGRSSTAIAVSLGTVFFLFIGIATCMRVMVAFSGSFQVQLQPFLAFIGGGSVGLFVALGWRNPSTAILIAALVCPFFTFYALTSFLLGQTLIVFLVTAFTYGFATAAMLVPAIYEFEVAATRGAAADE